MEGEELVGFVNVVNDEARAYMEEAPGYKIIDIPDHCKDEVESLEEMIKESIAETSDELMDKYFNAEPFTQEEVKNALKTNVLDGSIVPVLIGSGNKKRGIETLLNSIIYYFQSPMGDYNEMTGINTKTNEEFRGEYDSRKDFSAYVFRQLLILLLENIH